MVDGSLPRIAWDNLLPAATLVASSAAYGHDAAFICDDTLYRTWMPAAGGMQTVEAAWATPRPLTCWACYGHDLGAKGASIACEVWIGGGWVPFGGSAVSPAGSECIYRISAPVVTDRARFIVTAGTQPPRLAALFLGQDLLCEAGLRPGWTDPALGQRKRLVHATSRSGLPLPAVVEDEYHEGRLVLSDVPLDWAKAVWLPFKQACQTRPFFLRWHEAEAPCYCANVEFDEEAFTRPGFLSVGLTARMVTE